ncbi:MAG: serine/threonine protein kinase [Gemmataceae bacterium]
MSQNGQLSDLLLAWEESREQGETISPEQLCRNCPELLPKLREQIRALEALSPMLRLNPPESRQRVNRSSKLVGAERELTPEMAHLLRERLRIAGGFFLVVVLLPLLLMLVDVAYKAGLGWLDLAIFWAAGALLVGLVAPLFTKSQVSLKRLRWIEIGIFGLIMTIVVWVQCRMFHTEWLASIPAADKEREFILVLLDSFSLPWIVLILMYGMLIPNTWKRCASVVTIMWAIPLTEFIVLGLTNEKFGTYLLRDALLGMSLGLLLPATVAVFGSHKISTLQKEAFEAKKIGQYRLTKLIGQGGMGEVYLAEHQLLRRPCAIKLLRGDLGTDRKTLERFEREVHAMARLTHWNTVEIFDYGHNEDGIFYYVMEYLPGMTLQELVDQHGPIESSRAIHLLQQVCFALQEAHSIGLIHRDIKPSNIFVCPRGGVYDVVKLLDFGLVKPMETSTKLTIEGAVAGTPLYMSPEQAEAKALDTRSDLFSLGVVGYFLVTGRPPFRGPTVVQIFKDLVHGQPMPPRQLVGSIPEDFQSVLLRCLEKAPTDRYESARDLRQALAECQCANEWTPEKAEDWWSQHGTRSLSRELEGASTEELTSA